MSHRSDLKTASIVREYRRGLTSYELAKKYRCAQRTILLRLDRAGIARRHGTTRVGAYRLQIPIRELLDLYTAGFSMANLAERFCCRVAAIRRRLLNAGATLRPRFCSTPQTRKRMSMAQQRVTEEKWKGFVHGNYSFDYIQWRQRVFKRDRRTCLICGHKDKRNRLHAHHIQPQSTAPELRLSVENGATLCPSCHKAIRYKEIDYAQYFQYRIRAKVAA